MKWRGILFVMVGTLASAGGVAYAASSTAGGTDNSTAILATLIFSGLSQLGCAGYVVSMYKGKVDDFSKALPGLLSAIQASEKAIGEHAKHIEELFNSRNQHGEEITAVETLHEVLGCKDRLKELMAELKRKGATP